ncbi:3-carboxy-cis,cis-muconate cycloisomerase [Streptomyces azureus]|uniref:3-carboxy-cis,cis-muconate cycloisomerase n=1 Tax=Streptomyces azureus TaxID=146537 RepID=A0A0K8PFN8_STRAJ|nr:3-carboxy-cis,cis-muconate cycloisomerase [Streptomyces azureus]GAP46214.1 3-carboxy-cis,cis-muconate cycloisomerase [Streptomyces azureus]
MTATHHDSTNTTHHDSTNTTHPEDTVTRPEDTVTRPEDTATHPEGTATHPAPDLDSGLLSPVRAGTPVEAAVGDTAWLQAMLDAEAALARAQAHCGTVPAPAAAAITAAARAERLDLRHLALAARETANPVVGLVKALTAVVAADAPDAVEYVHRGSTSQDVFDTGAMLVARRALRLIVADLHHTADALAALAAEHRDTVMAGRTLALHAVPTTFGLKAAGWRQLVLEAAERLEQVAGRLPVSLGGAAGTLAGYLTHAGQDADAAEVVDDLTAAYAAQTGLAAPVLPWHALRTPIADLGAALAHTAGALGKIAADVLVLARTEVGEVTEPQAAGRGASSAMPHKRNPVLATLIRSAALQVPALAAVLTQCLVTEDERSAGVWHSEWQPLRECLRLTGGAAHTAVELARGLTVHPDRMRANLEATGGRIASERVSAVLTPRLGPAAARELLTQASLRAAETSRPLADVLAELPQLQGVLAPLESAALLDPAGYTGAAGALVDRALTGVRAASPHPHLGAT